MYSYLESIVSFAQSLLIPIVHVCIIESRVKWCSKLCVHFKRNVNTEYLQCPSAYKIHRSFQSLFTILRAVVLVSWKLYSISWSSSSISITFEQVGSISVNKTDVSKKSKKKARAKFHHGATTRFIHILFLLSGNEYLRCRFRNSSTISRHLLHHCIQSGEKMKWYYMENGLVTCSTWKLCSTQKSISYPNSYGLNSWVVTVTKEQSRAQLIRIVSGHTSNVVAVQWYKPVKLVIRCFQHLIFRLPI